MENTEKKSNLKVVLIIIFIILLVCFIGGLFFIKKNPISNDETAKTKMEKLSSVFYKYYYEENAVKGDQKETDKFFSRFTDIGITIRLKDLKVYLDSRKNEDYSEFKNCDENETKLTIYPKSPFGEKDYSIKVTTKCNLKK